MISLQASRFRRILVRVGRVECKVSFARAWGKFANHPAHPVHATDSGVVVLRSCRRHRRAEVHAATDYDRLCPAFSWIELPADALWVDAAEARGRRTR